MKKILVLGAMMMHVPLLMRAKERGLYVLTCDYLPTNIGHSYADEAYYDSTTDVEAVFLLAQKTHVDAVLTFNSDMFQRSWDYQVVVMKLLGLCLRKTCYVIFF